MSSPSSPLHIRELATYFLVIARNLPTPQRRLLPASLMFQPRQVDYILPKNATVYLTDAAVNGTAAYTVPKDTQADRHSA